MSAAPAATERYRSEIGGVACWFAVFPPIPRAARPFATFPATPGRDARLIGIIFLRSERRGIKTLRLDQRLRRDPGFDEFVRHDEAQRLMRAAGRQAGMGEMNMRECLLACFRRIC
jgi:hypothetical protein